MRSTDDTFDPASDDLASGDPACGDPASGGAAAAGPGGAPPEAERDEEAYRREFRRFFERHHRDLARLAHLMLGDPDSADDLAADALAAAWHRWDRVRGSEHPLAYVRRIVLNMCHSRIRALVRERDRLAALGATVQEHADTPDVPAVLDVRAALQRLPERKRACVVLRFAFDLSEKETARVLGITVGTVKSQTSKGVAELQRALGGPQPPGGEGRGAGPRPRPNARREDRRRADVHPGEDGPADTDGDGGRSGGAQWRRGAVGVLLGAVRAGERPQEGA
ncbi:SigE family RNA polymerase sigma factor [Actinomadura keratinilytica]|jgi:RNA polymerase sigma-70 factor (sigma-E family)|uniref:SigE family RNA polymerase sigma factor n=1 Tax=Actinomadura keratinilytica TaxID=547461 RepID=A0ABP7YES2_9ACTN